MEGFKLGFLDEAKLTSSQRSDFGIPELKKYPMPDKSHVLAAIRMFNHVDPRYERTLAKNIKAKMKQYGISPDQVGEKNRLKMHLSEQTSLYHLAQFKDPIQEALSMGSRFGMRMRRRYRRI